MNFTINHFNDLFPTDDVCIAFMFEQRFGALSACPKCGIEHPSYYRVRSKKVYECKDCGNQISPLAGTIFHKSETSLRSWFYAIFMFSVSKNGVSAKELERTLGVTYKTAWRMARLIRSLMSQGSDKLMGIVEADETYIGGKHPRVLGRSKKQIVFGVVERGGHVKAHHVRSSGARTLLPKMTQDIAPGTTINTDEWGAYRKLDQLGYSHTMVSHHNLEYVRGIAYTNTIEGFWSQLKRSLDGTYHRVSPKYLQYYVNEFVYRYNLRRVPVFPALVAQASQRVR